MTQREMVSRLWAAKCQLSKIRLDLQEVSHELSGWQMERIAKGLHADPQEMIDAVSIAWQAETLAIAGEQISRVHERLETDVIINEV